MTHKECPICGATYDAWDGQCDCQKEEAPTAGTAGTSNALKNTYIHSSTEREVCQVPAYKKEIDAIFQGIGGVV